MKFDQYKVVISEPLYHEGSIDKFESELERLGSRGWSLYGDLIVTTTPHKTKNLKFLTQALVYVNW